MIRLRHVALFLALTVLAAGAPEPEIYFSRSDPVQERIVRQIDAARHSIHLLIYSITDDTLASALVRAASRGVEVKVVCDKNQSSEKHSLAAYLLDKLGQDQVRIRSGRGRGVMHHKLAIYDQQSVTLGSFNWTNNARDNNWENMVIIHDPKLAASCELEFRRVWDSGPGKPKKTPKSS